jgi:hypothetical protein
MAVYTPDEWSILKFTGISVEDSPLYKVLAVWVGGFADPDRWKLNSGITKYRKSENWIEFDGYSGSTYRVHRNSERIGMFMSSIYDMLRNHDYGDDSVRIELISYEEFCSEFDDKSQV